MISSTVEAETSESLTKTDIGVAARKNNFSNNDSQINGQYIFFLSNSNKLFRFFIILFKKWANQITNNNFKDSQNLRFK